MDAFSVFLTIWRIAGLWAAALWLMRAGFPARVWLYDIASYLLVAAAAREMSVQSATAAATSR